MAEKLDARKKHLLNLVMKGAGSDGWAEVSAPVLSMLVTHNVLPPELVDIEAIGDDGRGRARLTEAGNNLMAAMEWL